MDWTTLQRVFWSARALPPEARDAFLLAECRDDTDALAQLRAMLQADATEGGLLDRTATLFTPLAEMKDQTADERVGPYIITEEIGRGGMGVVYRAYDPRLRRDVALKFIASGGRDAETQRMFMAEARAASALDHPHNCPIYDVGTTDDGRWFIAMAYCPGGSLAQRMASGPLPVAESVSIAEQMCDVLARAHAAGIVHRDIKPANIAFSERGDARLLDFGIAAIGKSAGIPAGTPSYMSPEQLRGEAVDQRTDLWALGAVLYEMLSGRKPFDDKDRTEQPPDLHTIRRDVSPALSRVVARALDRDPAKRYATANEFAVDLRNAQRRGATNKVRVLVAAVVVLVLTLGAVWAVTSRAPELADGDVDPNALVVLPFRVSGDPALAYLREGMVDLVSAKLTGEGGLRAVDPRGVISYAGAGTITEAEAVRIARDLRAAHALIGNVVGGPGGIIINALLVDGDGKVRSRASAEGSQSALSSLVDRLVAELLSMQAGEEPQRLASLMSTSLPALRAYLEGQTSYRRGDYAKALDHYGRALDLDSTFALAGLGLELADGWVGTGHAGARGRAAAWRWRQRLSARDRALLEVNVGTDYPNEPTVTDRLDATERALRLAPDRGELWYNLGDLYFHYGRVFGASDWEARAERAFKRALEMDSTFAPAQHHLIGLYARQRNSPELQRLITRVLQHEREGSAADFIHWRMSVMSDQRNWRVRSFDSLSVETLGWIALISTDDGISGLTARRAAQARAARSGTRSERFERLLAVHAAALNSGQQQLALAMTDSMRASQPDSTFYLRLRILDALYGDGERAAAAAAVKALVARGRAASELDRCVAALWNGEQRAVATTDTALALQVCNAALTGDVARLDELYRSGPVEFYLGDGHLDLAPIAAARIREARGDRAGALATLQRRPYFIGWQPFLAASLLHEMRLARSLGDAEGAARAQRHYRALQQ